MMTRLLRGAALAIALAAFVDPSFTMTARGRSRVAVILQDPSNVDARRVLDDLAARLSHDFDVVRGKDDSADAVAVVGTAYPAFSVTERQRVYTVTVTPSTNQPDARIVAVRAPLEAPRGTLVHLEADIEATNAAGTESSVILRAGEADVEVAREAHTWTGSQERWRSNIDVTPLGPAPWRLRVELSTVRGERAFDNDVADVLVESGDAARILFVDHRPSWAATFIRRALEADVRFDAATVSYPSKGIAVTSGDAASLRSTSLESVRAVVVGGLDRLASQDADILMRFMRERGGSVILVPDSLADAHAAARWLPVPASSELLLEKPVRLTVQAPLVPLQASELLKFDASPLSKALAGASGSNETVFVVTPVGAGRLAVSGALDAWRFRADDNAAFDRFWQAALYGLAMDARPAIDIDVEPGVLMPGEAAQVHVRVRRSAFGLSAADELKVSGSILAGNDPVRLWPDATPDVFHGSFAAPQKAGPGRFSVAVANHATATRSFVVASNARTARGSAPPLSLLSESHRGMNVTPDNTADLVQRIRRDVTLPVLPIEKRPMRSTWWIVPFAACLGGEWWLRRRSGLR